MLLNWLLKRPPKMKEAPKTDAPTTPSSPAPTKVVPEEIQKKRHILLDKCMEVMRDNFSHEDRYMVSCDYPGTENKAYLCMEQNAKDPTLRRLSTRVVRKGTDLCVMHYIHKGTVEEMTAYLGDKSHMPSLLESWQQLSDSVDKKN